MTSDNFLHVFYRIHSEVGDLSGKFGILYPSTGNTFQSAGVLTDYYPPYAANYGTSISNSAGGWKSIVFHCGSGTETRILCAELSTTDKSSCATAFNSFTDSPTTAPTMSPTIHPTSAPSVNPTIAPTVMPTSAPTIAPSVMPTIAPSVVNPQGTSLPTSTALASSNKYCAKFTPSEAGGASGYFLVDIGNSESTYSFNVDLSTFEYSSGVCAASLTTGGLKYHLHANWNNATASSSAGPSYCAAGVTGGHYDPNYGCSSASQNAAGVCTSLSRTSALGYTYACNSTDFAAGDYSAW